jgi:hypothetical protein
VKTTSIIEKRVDLARETELLDGTARTRVTHLSIGAGLTGTVELTIEERPYVADDGALDNRWP